MSKLILNLLFFFIMLIAFSCNSSRNSAIYNRANQRQVKLQPPNVWADGKPQKVRMAAPKAPVKERQRKQRPERKNWRERRQEKEAKQQLQREMKNLSSPASQNVTDSVN